MGFEPRFKLSLDELIILCQPSYCHGCSPDGIFVVTYSWFHRPSVLFRISIGTQVTWTNITWLSQPMEICSITTRPSSHVHEASIKTPKEIMFCRQTGLYILHTKWGLFVRGHLEPLWMFFVTSKTNFMFSNSTCGCLQANDVST